MSFKVVDKSGKFIIASEQALDKAFAMMSMDIESLAKVNVPVKNSHLQQSIGHLKLGRLHYITFAGGNANNTKAYARFQEFGGDGKRVVKHYSTPGTGKKFMTNAGKTVTKKIITYVKQRTNLIKI